MKISEDIWNYLQTRLGYTNDEMRKFRENPRNEEVISKATALMNKTIVVEVIDSHACNSQHKVGDKFYFDGGGNLLTELCPKRICIHALGAVEMAIWAAAQLFYAGVDPNGMRFNRLGCPDVGLQCGGWGHIAMEIRVEDRKKKEK